MKVHFLKLSFFIWLIVPVIFYGIYSVYGLPHMIWSRTWIDQGQGLNPFAYRHYIRCSYVGFYGGRTIPASNATCNWIIFYKQEGK